jgi:hypothetical protein
MLVQNPSTLRIGDRRQFRLGEDCTSALNFMRLRSLRDSFLRGFLRFVGLRRVKIKVVELARLRLRGIWNLGNGRRCWDGGQRNGERCRGYLLLLWG